MHVGSTFLDTKATVGTLKLGGSEKKLKCDIMSCTYPLPVNTNSAKLPPSVTEKSTVTIIDIDIEIKISESCATQGTGYLIPKLVLFYAFYAWWIHFPQSGALAEGHRCVIIPPGVLQVLQCSCRC